MSENAIISHPPYIPNSCTPNNKPHLSCSFSGVGSPRCIKCIDVDFGRREASSSHPMQVHHTLWTSVQVNKTCSLVSYCKAQKGHKFDCKAAPLKDKFCLEGNRWDNVLHIRIWTFGTLNIHLPYGGKHLYRTILASFFHFTNSQVCRMHGVQTTRFMPPYPSILLTLHNQNIVWHIHKFFYQCLLRHKGISSSSKTPHPLFTISFPCPIGGVIWQRI